MKIFDGIFQIIMSPYCGEILCENQIKKMSTTFDDHAILCHVVVPYREEALEPGASVMGAKALCIPFKQPKELSSDASCVCRGCGNKAKYYALLGCSY